MVYSGSLFKQGVARYIPNITEIQPMSTLFWNLIANRYARQKIANPAAYEVKLAQTRALLTPSSRVLEFGCGTGSTALLHAPHVSSILALDTSSRMVDIAKTKAENQGVGNVEFRVATVFDVETEPFDAVLGLNILHLVRDLSGTLRRCHALLRPGGVLVASTACIVGGWESWFLPIPGALGLLPAMAFFDEATLLQALKDAGFVLISSTRPGSPYSVFTIARRSE